MQSLSGTVGERGANARHDTALVQAILVATRRPADLDPRQARYLDTIDGDCGERTKRALRQFQNDRVFLGSGGLTSQAVPGAVAGLVGPGDPTWTALVAAVPAEFADLRVLTGSKTVYVAATADARDEAVRQLVQLTFQAAFRASVERLIARIFDKHAIVCSVCRDGDRRTFQKQYELLTSGRGVTSAGPGESNHNFGQAVDLGFKGLRWLRENGAVVESETWWLHELDPQQRAGGEARIFWTMLRDMGAQGGLHPGPADDRPHLQAWSDVGMDMASRLAAHLTRVGRMRWGGTRQRYQCDLGFGGRLFDVGSAAQIWSRQATINEFTLTQARTQPAAQPALSAPGGFRYGGGPQAAPRAVAPPATALDVIAMRDALRADFDAADREWQQWTSGR